MVREYPSGTWHSHSRLSNASIDCQEARTRAADQHLQRAKQDTWGMGSGCEHCSNDGVDCVAAREDFARHLRDVCARRTRRPPRHGYAPSLFLLVVTNDDVSPRAYQPCAAAELLLTARGSDDSAQVLDLVKRRVGLDDYEDLAPLAHSANDALEREGTERVCLTKRAHSQVSNGARRHGFARGIDRQQYPPGVRLSSSLGGLPHSARLPHEMGRIASDPVDDLRDPVAP